jgi:hypothetical protein
MSEILVRELVKKSERKDINIKTDFFLLIPPKKGDIMKT